jgi:hypothetical protein
MAVPRWQPAAKPAHLRAAFECHARSIVLTLRVGLAELDVVAACRLAKVHRAKVGIATMQACFAVRGLVAVVRDAGLTPSEVPGRTNEVALLAAVGLPIAVVGHAWIGHAFDGSTIRSTGSRVERRAASVFQVIGRRGNLSADSARVNRKPAHAAVPGLAAAGGITIATGPGVEHARIGSVDASRAVLAATSSEYQRA